MAINEHQNSTFNFAHAAQQRERQRQRQGERERDREHVTRTSWQHQHQSKLCQQLNYVICLVDRARAQMQMPGTPKGGAGGRRQEDAGRGMRLG